MRRRNVGRSASVSESGSLAGRSASRGDGSSTESMSEPTDWRTALNPVATTVIADLVVHVLVDGRTEDDLRLRVDHLGDGACGVVSAPTA